MVCSLRRWLVLSGLLASPMVLSALQAQNAPRDAEVKGVVIRADNRAPVVGVRLYLEGTEHVVVSDKNGKFKFPKVAAGEYLVRAEVQGQPPATSLVRLLPKDRMEMEFQVGVARAQLLPEIEVDAEEARISPIAAFNRRAMEGNGRYITRDVIEKRKPANLQDLLRSVPGVRIVCPRTAHVCALRFRRFNCDPGYFMDGIPVDPSVLYLTVPSDVEGIEIYSGPSETPAELEGFRSGCGVIAIWTRIGERPSRP